MKLPDVLDQLLHKKTSNRDVLLSLYLDVHSVSAAAWELGATGQPMVLVSETKHFGTDSWVDRTKAVDYVVGALEDKVDGAELSKVILGLPISYLTDAGEIKKEVRSEIKDLMQAMELHAVGFVPLHQALVYKMKKDEGVPPSVILLGVNTKTLTISMYKVGTLVGLRVIEKQSNYVQSVEDGLKSFTDVEVLPARILIYGSEAEELERMKHDLLKHPWPTRVNFLHFPKIEIVTHEVIIESISLAGASELGRAMGEDVKEEEKPVVAEEVVQHSTVAQAPPTATVARASHMEDEGLEASAVEEGEVADEVGAAQEVIEEDLGEPENLKEDANVVMVDAASLGFKKNVDILEHPSSTKTHPPIAEVAPEEIDEEDDEYDEGENKFSLTSLFASIKLPSLKVLKNSPPIPGGRAAIIIGLVVFLLGGIGFFLYWLLPHAKITVYEIPKDISQTTQVTVDPTATAVDGEHAIVPGVQQEHPVSGEKTIPVNGKKNVGDAAHGMVTIYNKSTNSKTFHKAALIASGSLQFSLDADVTAASASESIGSVTYGKVDVAVTAKQIGSQSNLAAGGDFIFVDIPTSSAVAHNDKAFSGGTSRSVTVVSRADTDDLVKALSDELLDKEKGDLVKGIDGNLKLIDETIKTSVTEKVFSQEIDQESKELQGKITLTVTGIAVRESDLEALFTSMLTNDLPAGYKIDEEKTTVTLSEVQVKKDGKIVATATMKSIALPIFDTVAIQKALAGKSVKDAQDYLHSLPGVGAMGVGYTFSPSKNRMPINAKNISVSVEIQ